MDTGRNAQQNINIISRGVQSAKWWFLEKIYKFIQNLLRAGSCNFRENIFLNSDFKIYEDIYVFCIYIYILIYICIYLQPYNNNIYIYARYLRDYPGGVCCFSRPFS